MWLAEDYKLMDKLAELAIEKLDDNLLSEIAIVRGKIGNEINDEIERKILIDYLDTKLGVTE